MSDSSRTAPGAATPRPPRTPVRVTVRTAFLLVVAVVAVSVVQSSFVAASRVIGWAVAAAGIAILVEPLINAIGRYIPRVAAVLLTFVVGGVGVGALVFGVVDDLDREVGRLRAVAPQATERLEERDDEFGEVMRDLRLSDRVDEFLAEVDERVGSGSGALAQNAPTAPVYFVSAILTIFLLIYGPSIVVGAVGQVATGDRRDRLLDAIYDAVTDARRTVAALLAQGLVVGVSVGIAASVIDLPAPVVLGLVAGVIATLPDLGILLGIVPTVALAAGLQSVRVGVVVFVAAFVAQSLEALWLRQRIDRWGVHVGPAVIWIVGLVGYAVHGVGMAAYGIGYSVLAIALLERLPRLREPAGAGDPVPATT